MSRTDRLVAFGMWFSLLAAIEDDFVISIVALLWLSLALYEQMRSGK